MPSLRCFHAFTTQSGPTFTSRYKHNFVLRTDYSSRLVRHKKIRSRRKRRYSHTNNEIDKINVVHSVEGMKNQGRSSRWPISTCRQARRGLQTILLRVTASHATLSLSESISEQTTRPSPTTKILSGAESYLTHSSSTTHPPLSPSFKLRNLKPY